MKNWLPKPVIHPGSVLTVKSVCILQLPGSVLTVKSVYIFTAHPSYMNYSEEFAAKARNSPWQCIDCKVCLYIYSSPIMYELQ